ncbi:hypothetical protein NPIL_685471 [Nephila pilipes]|uniref:RING-type domain-containing protein n=1 Tax=Nephila pilipes TaxID=299642 RepID=A0A8X6PEY9_NEPPI|nr:hypothetical protein NPIL_685471 [Nephila pilipes]
MNANNTASQLDDNLSNDNEVADIQSAKPNSDVAFGWRHVGKTSNDFSTLNVSFFGICDDEDPDECVFVTEKIAEKKIDSATGTTMSERLDTYPDENVHIVYENVNCSPEVSIVKEVGTIRNSNWGTNLASELIGVEHIPPVLMPLIDIQKPTTIKRKATSNHSTTPVLKPALLKNQKTSIATSSKQAKIECGVCYDTLEEMSSSKKSLMSTVCGHIFCSLCINEALKQSKVCPKCRKRLSSRQVHPIYV